MIHVLLVDDHPLMRDGIRTIINLESDMRVVGESFTGEDIVSMIKQTKADVVLMDINLPNQNGIDITAEIKESNPNCKVLILTMYDHNEYFMSALHAGADGYLLKDSPGEKVVEGIRVVFRGDSIIQPSLTKKLLNHQRVKQFIIELTHREKEVLTALVKGVSNKEIAEELYISERTVKIHINKIFKKMNVKSRSQAIIVAVKNQIVTL
ncbi:response regulator transcription factor [Gottfriedia acidiceleris]|uniref:response regulator transcription factor n=1 Tax=Gottfriedia acidiceleris TaxID=371036 RepID=UPI002F2622EB